VTAHQGWTIMPCQCGRIKVGQCPANVGASRLDNALPMWVQLAWTMPCQCDCASSLDNALPMWVQLAWPMPYKCDCASRLDNALPMWVQEAWTMPCKCDCIKVGQYPANVGAARLDENHYYIQ